MGFNQEAEGGVIREAVSHKLDIPLVNPSKNVWRDSTQTKVPNSPFQVGDSLRYTNVGHNDMVEIVDINKIV